MPRYTIGNVEIPVNQATASNVVANPAALAIEVQSDDKKQQLKDAKKKAAADSGMGGSALVIGALVIGAGWFLLKSKRVANRSVGRRESLTE